MIISVALRNQKIVRLPKGRGCVNGETRLWAMAFSLFSTLLSTTAGSLHPLDKISKHPCVFVSLTSVLYYE